MTANRLFSSFALAVMASVLGGCGYMGMVIDTWETEQRHAAAPSQVNLRRLAPDKCTVVYGMVMGEQSLSLPMLVAAVSVGQDEPELVDAYRIDRPGYYALYLPQGSYVVAAFADQDSDSLFEQHECIGQYNDGEPLEVHADEAMLGARGQVDIDLYPDAPVTTPFTLQVRVPAEREQPVSKFYPPGALRAFDDEIFSPKYGELGMYNPPAFLARAGIYFYALTERDMHKVPIVFVHGMGGTPREFAFLVSRIDTSRFDPWFFYYPSGESLTKLGGVFHELFLSGRIIDMRRRELIIVAHSMGGLVVRSALGEYAAADDGRFVKLVVSMCTPFGGDDGAALGVERAPLVVPSWRDVASGSGFLERLYDQPLPEHLNFQLFFGYRSPGPVRVGDNSDGTISLRSQLHPPAQAEAWRVTGFDETHTTILRSESVARKLNELLEDY